MKIKRCSDHTLIWFFLYLECICNPKGSFCSQYGTCNCTTGYSGNDCSSCAEGYMLSAVVDGEAYCSGEHHILFSYWNKQLAN